MTRSVLLLSVDKTVAVLYPSIDSEIIVQLTQCKVKVLDELLFHVRFSFVLLSKIYVSRLST